MEQAPNFDHSFKILLVGKSGVGKSSLLSQYINASFSDEYEPTIGVDLELKTAEYRGLKAKLMLYDTSGAEKYHPVITSYYQIAHAVLFLYDVNDQESLNDVGYWLQQLGTYNTNDDVCKILVGNKTDLTESRVVDTETAQAFANEEGMTVYETSAKTGENVAGLFDMIVEGLIAIDGGDRLYPHRNFFSKPAGKLKRRSACCAVV